MQISREEIKNSALQMQEILEQVSGANTELYVSSDKVHDLKRVIDFAVQQSSKK